MHLVLRCVTEVSAVESQKRQFVALQICNFDFAGCLELQQQYSVLRKEYIIWPKVAKDGGRERAIHGMR